MSEMKDAINALGEFQELKSQVKKDSEVSYIIFMVFLVFSSLHTCRGMFVDF